VPFGGDNHSDANLATEASENVSGIASLVSLFQQLTAANLQDQVSFLSLNVFGRTMGPGTNSGRNHNANHELSLAIGKPFASAVIGGVAPMPAMQGGDYGAVDIDSKTGAASPGADIAAADSMASYAKTVMTAFGGDPNVVNQQITSGSVVSAMLA
jgi:hypothetical protein